MTDDSLDVFEFDSNLTSVEKMKLAFGVARKRLEELQNQRKAKLPIALEQRLGKSSSENATSDRKPSATAQAPVRSSMSPLVSDSSQSHAQYGFPDSTDQSANTQTDGRSGNFEYSSHPGGQVNERGSFKSMARQPSPNMQYESMPTSTDPSQFGGVNWGVSHPSSFFDPVNSGDLLRVRSTYADNITRRTSKAFFPSTIARCLANNTGILSTQMTCPLFQTSRMVRPGRCFPVRPPGSASSRSSSSPDNRNSNHGASEKA